MSSYNFENRITFVTFQNLEISMLIIMEPACFVAYGPFIEFLYSNTFLMIFLIIKTSSMIFQPITGDG